MILKVDSLVSLIMLFVFILLAFPFLFSTYDIPNMKALEEGCRNACDIASRMPYMIRPNGNMTVIELPPSDGLSLDLITINGTLEWVVRVKCGV